MKKYIIYTLNDPVTHQPRYVGKTRRELEARLNGHLFSAANKSRKDHRALWVYNLLNEGLRPIIEPLDTVYGSEEDSLFWEGYWISQLLEWDFPLTNSTTKRQKGLNPKLQGKKVYQYTLDGEFVQEFNSAADAEYTFKYPAEAICQACRKGEYYKGFQWSFTQTPSKKPYSPGYDHPGVEIHQYDSEGKYLKTWDKISTAANTLGLFVGNISSVAKGKIRTAGGCFWSYEKVDNYPVKTARTNSKGVIQYSLSGEEIQFWSSYQEVYKSLGISPSSLCSVVKGKSQSAGGYHWKQPTQP